MKMDQLELIRDALIAIDDYIMCDRLEQIILERVLHEQKQQVYYNNNNNNDNDNSNKNKNSDGSTNK